MAPNVGSEEIVVEGRKYTTEALSKFHPGGSLFVKVFSGLDASEAFLTYHRKNFPHEKVKDYLIDEIKDESNQKPAGWKDEYLELARRVEKVLPRHKSFAPTHYFVKAAFLLLTGVLVEFYMHSWAWYPLYLMAFLGYVYAAIALNIQHDANHGALSRNPLVNRLLGMSQNWIGGSAICWIHQHVVQHHVHTNDVDNDPDLDGGTLLRMNPKTPLMQFHVVQHIYFFVLLAFYGFSVVINTINNIINGKHFIPMSILLKKHRVFEITTTMFFLFRMVFIPLYQVPTVNTILGICLTFMIAGYYLSFFFILSHNFKGVHIMDEESKNKSFLYNQVVTSSNVGGPILCFLNGGLNYQIEHHLFPRINHCHYPTIAPIVREFCKEKNIPYVHFPTIADNLASCVDHLFDMGSQDVTSNTSIDPSKLAKLHAA